MHGARQSRLAGCGPGDDRGAVSNGDRALNHRRDHACAPPKSFQTRLAPDLKSILKRVWPVTQSRVDGKLLPGANHPTA
jgi:hypothetical protein